MAVMKDKRVELLVFFAKVQEVGDTAPNSFARHWATKDARDYAKSTFTSHEIFLLKIRHPYLREILDGTE